MSKLAALGAGPVTFTDSTGSLVSIPLSLIYFEDGAVGFTAPAGMSSGLAGAIGEWLSALAREGVLTAGAAAPPVPAMVVAARDAGAAGNSIVLAFNNVRPDPGDASQTIFDATVTETNRYALLSPDTVKTVLGTAAGNGQSPGLVFVSSAGTPEQPQNGTYALAGDPATVDIPKADGSPGAFTLTSKAGGADAALTTVTISQADDPDAPDTFGLTAVWTKSANGIGAADLQTEFGYDLTVSPPAGGALAAPTGGTFALAGGAEAQTAKAASVTIPANQ